VNTGNGSSFGSDTGEIFLDSSTSKVTSWVISGINLIDDRSVVVYLSRFQLDRFCFSTLISFINGLLVVSPIWLILNFPLRNWSFLAFLTCNSFSSSREIFSSPFRILTLLVVSSIVESLTEVVSCLHFKSISHTWREYASRLFTISRMWHIEAGFFLEYFGSTRLFFLKLGISSVLLNILSRPLIASFTKIDFWTCKTTRLPDWGPSSSLKCCN